MLKAHFYRIVITSLCLLTTPSFSEPPNLSLVHVQAQIYHDSGAYDKDIASVLTEAQHYLEARLKNAAANKEKLALVLDIDETSVSNYNKMLARQFVATRAQLHDEINEANAPAIPLMLTLYQEAIKKGVTVFFITGRNESERAATEKNLATVGYKTYQHLYLRPNLYTHASIIPFKTQARADIENQGYTIIASLGDQDSDLIGGYAEKTFKLPNPYYYLP